MSSMEREYHYLIARAIREKNLSLAGELQKALSHHQLDEATKPHTVATVAR